MADRALTDEIEAALVIAHVLDGYGLPNGLGIAAEALREHLERAHALVAPEGVDGALHQRDRPITGEPVPHAPSAPAHPGSGGRRDTCTP